MKRLLKSRSGVAVVTVILFMLVTFSLCALLTTMALSGNAQTKIESVRLMHTAELEQIGENFLHSGTVSSEAYRCEKVSVDGVSTLTVKSKSSGDTLLCVIIEEHGEGENILRYWGKIEPTT